MTMALRCAWGLSVTYLSGLFVLFLMQDACPGQVPRGLCGHWGAASVGPPMARAPEGFPVATTS